jgi:oligopeptide/dipeptide ABC transporter ATP-binding protein
LITVDEKLLEVDQLSVEMPLPDGSVALPVDSVSFDMAPGESIGVVGESGAGKSMLAKSIARLVRPPAEIVGTGVRVGGRNILRLDDPDMRRIRGSEIAFVFQDPMTSMDPVSRVSTQMAEAVREASTATGEETSGPRRRRRIRGRSMNQLLANLLRQLGIGDPERVLRQYPAGLSGGMNQRVMIGMAVAAGARLVIADEPTTALDPTTQIQILDLLSDQQDRTGYGLLLISHDIRIIGGYCDRVLVMYGGRVVESGSTNDVLSRPTHPYTRLLIRSAEYVDVDGPGNRRQSSGTPGLRELAAHPQRCHFAPRCSFAQEVCWSVTPKPATDPATGTVVACHGIDQGFVPPPSAVARASGARVGSGAKEGADDRTRVADGTTLLSLDDVSLDYRMRRSRTNPAGLVPAVRAVDLVVTAGQTLALVGESGCGKSTTGEVVAHLRRPTRGTIRWMGTDLWALPAARRAAELKRIQVVFQNPRSSLDPRWTVERVLREPVHSRADDRAPDLSGLLSSVGLGPDLLERRVTELSGGQAQRVAIARALVGDPRFILLDEPTSALDVTIRTQILQLLRELKESRDLTYLFISHDFDAVRALADRVAVMYLGKVVESGPVEILGDRARHPYTMALRDSLPALPGEPRSATTPVEGEVPSLTAIPSGCSFRTRCPFATELCTRSEPALKVLAEGHLAACHYADRDLVAPSARGGADTSDR